MSDSLPSSSGEDSSPNRQDEASEGDRVSEATRRELAVFAGRMESFVGPVPRPDILRGYEELVPGSAGQILAQAQHQTEHRIAIERTVIESDTRRSRMGLQYGFVLSALAIGGGCLLVGLGHDWAGATIATAAVASLAGVFVYGSRERRQELRRKGEVVPPSDT